MGNLTTVRAQNRSQPSKFIYIVSVGIFSFLIWFTLFKSSTDKVILDSYKEQVGPIEKYLNLKNLTPPNIENDVLYIRRVRQYDKVVPAKILSTEDGRNETRGKCVVFSCSSPAYFLVDESLKANQAYECDRIHFATYVYNSKNEKVATTWCRVPLLKHYKHYFEGYERILYVDSDIIYRDPYIMKTDCDTNNPSVIISTKPANGKLEFQMNWLLMCHPKDDQRLDTIFSKWDEHWKDVNMQDQTVFNDIWNCGDLDGALKCVDNSFDNAIVVFHCGGYLTKFLRPKCMRKHF